MTGKQGRTGLIIRQYQQPLEYAGCWQQMMDFTRERSAEQADEVWLLEHQPVFTTGIRDSDASILDPGRIPVVSTDRGGLVTYHGPGQLVVYVMINLRRLGIGLKSLVNSLEQVTIDLLSRYSINAARKENAPGVYVDGRKIASLGLRVQHGCTYHGLSLNVDMELSPFDRIVPCGLEGIEMTTMRKLGVNCGTDDIGRQFAQLLARELGYNEQTVEMEENRD